MTGIKFSSGCRELLDVWMVIFLLVESAPLPIKIKNTSGGGVPQVYRKATCPTT